MLSSLESDEIDPSCGCSMYDMRSLTNPSGRIRDPTSDCDVSVSALGNTQCTGTLIDALCRSPPIPRMKQAHPLAQRTSHRHPRPLSRLWLSFVHIFPATRRSAENKEAMTSFCDIAQIQTREAPTKRRQDRLKMQHRAPTMPKVCVLVIVSVPRGRHRSPHGAAVLKCELHFCDVFRSETRRLTLAEPV